MTSPLLPKLAYSRTGCQAFPIDGLFGTRGFSIRSLFSRNLNTKSLVSTGGESTSEAGTTSSISKNLTFSLMVSKYKNCLRRSFISNFDSFDYFFRSEMSSSLKCCLCLSGQSAKRSSRVTLMFPHTTQFCPSIVIVAQHVQPNVESFSRKVSEQNVNDPEKLQALPRLQETNTLR